MSEAKPPEGTPPENAPPAPKGGIDGWPAAIRERFEQRGSKIKNLTTQLEEMRVAAAAQAAEIEKLKTAPPPKKKPAEKKGEEVTPSPQMDALKAQIEALTASQKATNDMLIGERARAQAAENRALLASQVGDTQVQDHIMQDYKRACEGQENSPAFSEYVDGLKEHPLYKSHFTTDQPPERTRQTDPRFPNSHRGAPPPGSGYKFDSATLARMTSAERTANKAGIAAEAIARGEITMSPALQKRLGIKQA